MKQLNRIIEGSTINNAAQAKHTHKHTRNKWLSKRNGNDDDTQNWKTLSQLVSSNSSSINNNQQANIHIVEWKLIRLANEKKNSNKRTISSTTHSLRSHSAKICDVWSLRVFRNAVPFTRKRRIKESNRQGLYILDFSIDQKKKMKADIWKIVIYMNKSMKLSIKSEWNSNYNKSTKSTYNIEYLMIWSHRSPGPILIIVIQIISLLSNRLNFIAI